MDSNNIYKYSTEYHFQVEKMDNETFILERLAKEDLSKAGKKAYENILRFLYQTDYCRKTYRNSNRKYSNYLSEAERIILFRLETRSSGSERYRYGMSSVMAMKRAKYKCEICNEKDLRCLEIDHKNGRKKPNEGTKSVDYGIDDFQCLCANHHRIKTVTENQQN